MKERLREELRRYFVVSSYLFVCFGALLLYKSAVLREIGQHFLPLGLAAGKALILGKFVLIGEAARLGTRVRTRTLWQRIAVRTVFFLALLIALTVVEELLVGLVHGRSVAQTVTEFSTHSLFAMGATCIVMLLVLVPLVTVTEVSGALGPGVLRKLLSAPPPDR